MFDSKCYLFANMLPDNAKLFVKIASKHHFTFHIQEDAFDIHGNTINGYVSVICNKCYKDVDMSHIWKEYYSQRQLTS